MDAMTCCTVVGYFLLMFRIHTLVLFIAGNLRFHGLLLVECDTYEML